jgi:hypothetical protein
VIKKPRGRGGHSPHWAAAPEKIIIIIIIIIISLNISQNEKCLGKRKENEEASYVQYFPENSAVYEM